MIRVDLSKCTGCRRCETTCAFFHTGKVGRHIARIKVMNAYETGIDGPVVCCQCREQYCMDCPVNALSTGSQNQIVYSPTICVRCGSCENQCPIGALEIFDQCVYVCDLCGGRPQCVEACTEGAIVYDPEGEHPSLHEYREKTEKMSPSEKRYYYVTEQGVTVRKKWRDSHG
ncbi:MAG: 4Fe-4S dicluster domain-containing protein [Theionarchaea archaeon]|nr:4Fe-4S dicluster domain-containing protein [Theionarchaea archaeon]